MVKKFILNADDFGMSNAFNRAVLEGYNHGFLTSASICANGNAFDAAVNEILPECPNLGIGVHLNIIEGNSLLDSFQILLLVDSKGKFKNGYLKMIQLSNNAEFLAQVEKEFRAQIEKVQAFAKIDHIDSHVHVHGIPKIFELTCKLAQEYEIKNIRTQFEHFYIVSDIKKHTNFKYPINLIKVALLNYFTIQNKKIVSKYNLSTNDYLIGVGYTALMDDKTIHEGLASIKAEDAVVEALIHPCNYSKNIKNKQRHKEFLITQNLDLKDKIQRLGFEIGNYKS